MTAHFHRWEIPVNIYYLTNNEKMLARHLKIAVAAPEKINKLEIVRNSRVIADLADGHWFVQAEFIDKQRIANGTFYYVRATTDRNDFAWSSPIWVDIDKQ